MAEASPSRIARLTVCDTAGSILGTTREFTVPSPYWGDVEPLVSAARDELGQQITVLRLLEVERSADDAPDRTAYLVEASGTIGDLATPTGSAARALQPQRFRMPWAEPGGPARQLSWAEASLDAQGIRLAAPAVQVRTWNLSSIWRLPTNAGTVWLKAVPPFFAHEGAVLERFAGFAVPELLARADGVCLLADVAGDDLYQPTDQQAVAMIDALMAIQRGPGADVDALLSLGLPDWRVASLARPAAHTLAIRATELEGAQRRALEALIDGLDARQRELTACGIPDSLVHGDFHPGNVRGAGPDVTILDWGDSGVGHPLLDAAAFTERMPSAQRAIVEAHWTRRWREAIPGSDPVRAARLIAPVAALRQALIYRHFLDHIEPDERIYHETDDVLWLRRTAALLAA